MKEDQLHTVYIKNMVCPRCISVVTEAFRDLQLPVKSVKLGEVDLTREPNSQELGAVKKALQAQGFEVLEDKKAELVEKIKVAIIELIRTGEIENLQINLSDYLVSYTGRDYHYLSTVFSEQEDVTIARYVVLQKIERVKELITYNELTLSQIAYQLGYSSVAHLSAQFKQVTGITTSDFKKESTSSRKPLDQVL